MAGNWWRLYPPKRMKRALDAALRFDDEGGGASLIHQASVTLDNDQIKGLPTTPAICISPLTGQIPLPVCYSIQMRRADGPSTVYTNLGDLFALYFAGPFALSLLAPYDVVRNLFIANPYSPYQAIFGNVSEIISAANEPEITDWGQFAYTSQVAPADPAGSYGVALQLDNYTAGYGDNLGDLTAGNAANTLMVSIAYCILDLSSGLYV